MYKRNKFYKKINSRLYKVLGVPNPNKKTSNNKLQKAVTIWKLAPKDVRSALDNQDDIVQY